LRLYRIAGEKHSAWESAVSGYGAWRFGARWNSPGQYLVYTSETQTLAAFETLVHCDELGFRQSRMVVTLEIPDDAVLQLNLADLPENWIDMPYSQAARAIGDAWLLEQASVGLSVPSVIFPQAAERNVLLNPAHPDFSRLVQHVFTERFVFDERIRLR
jgi:RES domain-containing protein